MSENPSQAADVKLRPGTEIDDARSGGLSGGDAQMNPDDHDDGGGHAMEDDQDGAVESEEMDRDGPADPGNPGDQQGSMTAHVGGNQLTLSFQGEVFVFDSVSPEKVQAVLLLLGGRELSTSLTPFPSSSLTPNKRANFPHRIASLMRFREKRKERNFDKKIRYNVRKEVALRMQRNKGQFISSKSKPEDATLGVTSWDATQRWGAVEDRSQAAPECRHCGTSAKSTPMMRRGPDGPRTLCNACGLMWANKGTMRDLSKSPTAPVQNPLPELNAGMQGTIDDLSRNPSASIQEALSEPKEGKNTSEAGAVQPLAIAANGHDSS